LILNHHGQQEKQKLRLLKDMFFIECKGDLK
jgi:hypothetical protein